MQHIGFSRGLFAYVFLLLISAVTVVGQENYPFRNTQLSDDERIADLLGRLTLDEKVELMDGHAKVPRLHLVLSDEAEGLHGLALGGPGQWGPRGLQPLPTTIFPQEKGLRRNLGYSSTEENWRS